MKSRKLLPLLLIICLLAFTVGCKPTTGDPKWDRVLESVKGTTVEFYIWNKDPQAMEWFKTVVTKHVSEQYDITLKIVEVEYEDYLAQLRDDKKHERTMGDGDLMWLNGPSFAQMKSEGLLYGPFADQVANAKRYLSPRSMDALYFDGTPIEGYALPFNQTQVTFYYNEDLVYDPPTDFQTLSDIVKQSPGLFTYPNPSDPVGGAFVRSAILNFTPEKEFLEAPLTDAQLKALVMPGLQYLKGLKPNLYKSGAAYPQTALALQDLFANSEVFVTMSMDYRHAHTLTGDAVYPMGTRPFYLNVGVGDREHMAIPYFSKNKSGAMVVMNALMDLTTQTQKLSSKAYQGMPVYDFEMLDAADISTIKKAAGRKTIPDITLLMDARAHDIPQKYHQKIVQLWQQVVMAP